MNSQEVSTRRDAQLEGVLFGHLETIIDGSVRTSAEPDLGRLHLAVDKVW